VGAIEYSLIDLFFLVRAATRIGLPEYTIVLSMVTMSLDSQNRCMKMPDLLRLTGKMECRDPRDRIFALAGMASEAEDRLAARPRL
jgi:hypothetical protein